jgi:hypothetical protein
MPSLVGGDTETVCGKLKSGNRFLEPNFELGLKWALHAVRFNRYVG